MGNRRGRGINKVWVYVGLAAVALGVGVTSAAALARTAEPVAATSTVPQAQFTSAPKPPQITTIGDSYTAGSGEDSGANARWPSLLAQTQGIRVQNLAIGSVGYVQANDKAETLLVESTMIAADTDAVVFFGSRNDQSATPSDLTAASAEAIANALKTVPADKVLVIGPAWVDDRPPRYITQARDAISGSAESAGVAFVDPLAEGWFVGAPNLIGADRVHPNDDGHRYLAKKMAPLVTELLAD